MPVTKINSYKEGKWPDDVGILAMDVYFPSKCVNQTELESFDGVSQGKYTIGLGQTNMGFCDDLEDINSLCLTVVQGLMQKYNISYSDIGRLEVGTETILDKSKSVKTVLMQLFVESGNHSVEGIDTTNACYGGTQALFNAVSWIESSAWDGRFALVVAGDIAVYASGNARPTWGVGAVAMLIGPNAPLVMERGLRAIHMEHAYDFYKPDLSSEYPMVDGKLSIQCYLRSLDQCYQSYADKASTPDKTFTLQVGDYFLFHSPFTKLVAKSLGRLKLIDFVRNPAPDTSTGGVYAGLDSVRSRTLESTIGDRDVEKMMLKYSASEYAVKTEPSTLLGKEVGNMYTASLYGGIASLLALIKTTDLVGKRLVLFSYGSGLASAMYSLQIKDSPMLIQMATVFSDIPKRLASRKTVSPSEFESTMQLRERTHHTAPYKPVGDPTHLFPGTFYITNCDEKHRRSYSYVNPSANTSSSLLNSPLVDTLANGSS